MAPPYVSNIAHPVLPNALKHYAADYITLVFKCASPQHSGTRYTAYTGGLAGFGLLLTFKAWWYLCAQQRVELKQSSTQCAEFIFQIILRKKACVIILRSNNWLAFVNQNCVFTVRHELKFR